MVEEPEVNDIVPEAIDPVSDGEKAAVREVGNSDAPSDINGAVDADDKDVTSADGVAIPVPKSAGPNDAIVQAGKVDGTKEASGFEDATAEPTDGTDAWDDSGADNTHLVEIGPT